MKEATYKIIFYPKVNKYVGIAWNYDQAVLIASRDYDSYVDARKELQTSCDERNVHLKWFDGHYKIDPYGREVPNMIDASPID